MILFIFFMERGEKAKKRERGRDQKMCVSYSKDFAIKVV